MKFAHLAIDCMCFSSHPARGTWIEIDRVSTCVSALRSHPARGTWIEMALLPCPLWTQSVAPRTGYVD